MQHIVPPENAPASWHLSYQYDLLEIYGSQADLGYSYAYQNRKTKTLDVIQSLVKTGARILDLAAAQGNFTLALAEMGYYVTWNDLRGDLVDYVKQKYDAGIVDYAVGNVFELNFEAAFDLVLIAEVIEHVAHPDDFLEKVSSLVRPGGYVVMSTPNGCYFRNPLPRFSDFEDTSVFESVQFQPDGNGHIFLLHPDEIERLSHQSGLQIQKMWWFTNPLTTGHIKLSPLLNLLPERWVKALEGLTSLLPVGLSQKLNTHTLVSFHKPQLCEAD